MHGDEEYSANYFSLCGHVARMTINDPKRETSRMYVNKNMEWLRNLKKEVGSQSHRRLFRVWSWEQAVAQCVGTEWMKMAQDRAVWRLKAGEMIMWRKKTKNGGPGGYSF